jgi:hypothetical protein
VPEPTRATLRVDPEAIPQLRALLVECLELIGQRLQDLSRSGRLYDAWMNDPVSLRMRDLYNERVIDAPDGGYAALRAYEVELRRVYEELGRMEVEYRRTEDSNSGLFGSRA